MIDLGSNLHLFSFGSEQVFAEFWPKFTFNRFFNQSKSDKLFTKITFGYFLKKNKFRLIFNQILTRLTFDENKFR